MRWKGIIFLGLLFAIILLIFLIFSDALIEAELEDMGSFLVGARVDIDDLDFSLTELYIRWERLQVTNPKNTMKNMIETGKCDFNMEVLPLLSNKIIIENITISGLRTGTDRETDGKLSREEKQARRGFIERTSAQLQKNVTSSTAIPLTSLKKEVNVDSIMKILQIKSVEKIRALQDSLQDRYAYWQKQLSQMKVEDDLKLVESKIKALDINKIKTVEEFQKSLKDVTAIKTTIDSLNKLVQGTKKDLTSDLDITQKSLQQVDNWIEEDYARARALAKLPEINLKNIGKLIFGEILVSQFTHYLNYIAQARRYADKYKSVMPEKEESPPRLKGQSIYFYNKNARPDFWIKNIDISGIIGDQIALNGQVQNIVSNQRLIGAMTNVAIKGSSEKGAKLTIDGELNYLDEMPAEKFKLNYNGFSLSNTYLSRSKFLPNKVRNGIGSVMSELNLSGDQIHSEIKFVGSSLNFDFKDKAKPANKFEEIVQSIMQRISSVDFVAKVNGKADALNFSLNSNLDDVFVKETKAILSKEIDDAKQKIKVKVDNEVGKYRMQLKTLVQEKEKILSADMQKYEKMVNEKIKMADEKKKEIEKKIENEKSKLKDKVKDIFKF